MVNGYERISELKRVHKTIPATLTLLEKKYRASSDEWTRLEIVEDIKYWKKRQEELGNIIKESK